MIDSNWKGGFGDWGTTADWSGGVPNSAAAVANITAAGSYVTVGPGESFSVGTLTLEGTGNTLEIDGTLHLAGAFTLGSGTLTLEGTIDDGTILDGGGVVNWSDGTLKNVDFSGILDLSATLASLNIDDRLTLTGAGGSGPGAIKLTGTDSILYFNGSQLLDNATITIGTNAVSGASIEVVDTRGPATLRLGKGLDIIDADTAGNTANLGAASADGTLMNQGSLTLDTSGGILNINQGNFINEGVVSTGNGSTLDITADLVNRSSLCISGSGDTLDCNGDKFINELGGVVMFAATNSTINIGYDGNYVRQTFVNRGIISIGEDDTVYLDSAHWTTTGTLSLGSGDTLILGGDFTLANLGMITGISDLTIGYSGTLRNAGTIFAVGPGSTYTSVTLSGTIRGGTISDSGSGMNFSGGSLDGVIYEGTLDLSTYPSAVFIRDGLRLTGTGGSGPGSMELGGGSSIVFEGSQSFDKATVTIGLPSPYGDATIDVGDDLFPMTLRLGKHFQIISGAEASTVSIQEIGQSTVINDGSILAGTSASQFGISGGSFDNEGSIAVSDGDTLTIDSDFINHGSITFTGSGATLEAEDSDFVNAAGGMITFGATNSIFNIGHDGDGPAQTFFNSGTIEIAANDTVYAGAAWCHHRCR
jgi:hypothetical protein